MKMFNNRENIPYLVKDKQGKEKTIWHSRSVACVGHIFLIHNFKEFLTPPERNIYFLAVKRGEVNEVSAGKWCVPCGYLDWDETVGQCAMREVFEETGFNILRYANNSENQGVDNLFEDYNNYEKEEPFLVFSGPYDADRDGEIEVKIQNVSFHFGAVYLYEGDDDLPRLTTKQNAVVGEVETAEWVPIEELWSDNCREFAFNHRKRTLDFWAHLKGEGIID